MKCRQDKKKMSSKIVFNFISVYILFFLDGVLSFPTSVNITVMVPTKPESRLFSTDKVKPAIEIGIRLVKIRNILPFITINATYVDTECNAAIAPVEAFRVMNAGTNILFGPVCDYSLSPVARYAPIWKIPVITPGGLSEDFQKNRLTEYQTLTRIGAASFDSVTSATLKYISNLNWKKVYLISERSNHGIMYRLWYLLGSAVFQGLKKRAGKFEYDQDMYDPKFKKSIDKILREKIGIKYAGKSFFLYLLSI